MEPPILAGSGSSRRPLCWPPGRISFFSVVPTGFDPIIPSVREPMIPPLPRRRITGGLLVLVGVGINPWFTGRLLSPGKTLASPAAWLVVLASSALLIAAGIIHMRTDFTEPSIGRCLLLGAAGAALLFLALELASYVVLRSTAPRTARLVTHRHALLGDDHPPGTAYTFHPLFGWKPPADGLEHGSSRSPTHYLRDRFGFVREDPGETVALDPDAAIRIVVVGGSSVRGVWNPPEASIPARLESILASRTARSVNVVNAGVPGWFSVNEIAYLAQEVLPILQPDLVIVLDGAADVARSVRAGERFTRRMGIWYSNESYLYDRRLQRFQERFTWLRDRPALVFRQLLRVLGVQRLADSSRYFLGRAWTARESPLGHDVRKLDRKECAGVPVNPGPYLQNVRTGLGLARAHGVPLLWSLQPVITHKNSLTDSEHQSLNRMRARAYFQEDRRTARLRGLPPRTCWTRVQKTFYRRVRRGFDRIQETIGEPIFGVMDLADLFRGDRERRFADALHYTAPGNRRVARALARRVENRLLAPGTRRP